jgi:hypothetical protein
MKHLIAATLLLGLWAANATAQQKPNFSGTWTAEVNDRQQTLTISQDGDRLTVTRDGGGAPRSTLVYRLDGSDSKNETVNHSGETSRHVSRANWISDALIITTTTVQDSIGPQGSDSMTIYCFKNTTLTTLTVTSLNPSIIRPGMGLQTVAYTKQ